MNNQIIILIGFFLIFVSMFSSSFGEECNNIDLKYSINGGNISAICLDSPTSGINLEIKPETSGNVTIHIPKSLYDFTLSCVGYFVLVDDDEAIYSGIEQNIDPYSQYYLILKIPFQENSSLIRIIGSTQIPTGKNIDCKKDMQKIIDELPPLKQIELFRELSEIKCKDNLELIYKSTDNSPACVKSKSIPKLIERGWARV